MQEEMFDDLDIDALDQIVDGKWDWLVVRVITLLVLKSLIMELEETL